MPRDITRRETGGYAPPRVVDGTSSSPESSNTESDDDMEPGNSTRQRHNDSPDHERSNSLYGEPSVSGGARPQQFELKQPHSRLRRRPQQDDSSSRPGVRYSLPVVQANAQYSPRRNPQMSREHPSGSDVSRTPFWTGITATLSVVSVPYSGLSGICI